MATKETWNNGLVNDPSLQYLIRSANTTAGRRKAIVLLHGVGSNEQDLFSLATLLPEDFTVISPRGPFMLGEGRYAWYQVDFSSGRPEINAGQEAQSRNTIKKFISQVIEKYSLDEVYLGGFSQGAIMSYSVGLTQPGLVNGVLSFSGRILEEIRPQVQHPDKLKNLKVFIAHGTQDNVLPVHHAHEARAYLNALGVVPTYRESDFGHQIAGGVLTAVSQWMKA